MTLSVEQNRWLDDVKRHVIENADQISDEQFLQFKLIMLDVLGHYGGIPAKIQLRIPDAMEYYVETIIPLYGVWPE